MADALVTAPVVVPPHFVGTSTQDSVAPPSSAVCGLVRSWDYEGTRGFPHRCIVARINPSAGAWDWQTFDELLSNNGGKQIIITLGQPADYLVSRAAVGGSYIGGKANMLPDDLVAWSAVVQAIVGRAKNTHGRTGLIWQLWNEIDQPASYGDSVPLLGPYTKATAQAIRAVDPGAIVVGPSISGSDAPKLAVAVAYITASDGAGGTVQQWLDGVALHFYVQGASQLSQYDNGLRCANDYLGFQGAMAEAKCSLPIYVTETGVIAANSQGWRSYQHRLLVYAALGARCCLTYCWDTASYPIAPYEAQFNAVASLLRAGAVITRCEVGLGRVLIDIDGQRHAF